MSEQTLKANAEILAMPTTVGGSTLAYLFDVSDSYISKMAERGIIPKSGRGEYPFIACLKAYIDYLNSDEPDEGVSYQTEKTRLKTAQADKIEFELAVARQEYIPAVEVAATWGKIMGEVKAAMINLPSKIGAHAVAVQTPEEGFNLVMNAIKPMLKELSETEVSVESDRPPET